METLWKGMFSPNIQKSIGTVTFVPLLDMSPRDWNWLDYANIRTVAKNRIDSCILRGDLLGFFRVMIEEKARAKNEYLWPVTPELLAEFESDNINFFGNEAEALTEAQAVATMEELRTGMFLVPLPTLIAIMRLAATLAEKKRKAELNKVEEKFLGQLKREDAETLTLAVMFWEMTLAEVEAVLDELPESDEADALADWVRMWSERIEDARQGSMQIAAARDLTGLSENDKVVK